MYAGVQAAVREASSAAAKATVPWGPGYETTSIAPEPKATVPWGPGYDMVSLTALYATVIDSSTEPSVPASTWDPILYNLTDRSSPVRAAADDTWFQPRLNRAEAERRLCEYGEMGTFLVRQSAKGSMVLSVLVDGPSVI